MTLEDLANRWIAVWSDGDVSVLDDLHADDFVDHDPGGRAPDLDGFKAGVVAIRDAFPDLAARVESLVVDESAGDIAVRWSAVGTHTGEYLGAAPTGATVRFKGIEIIRVRDGRIVERWGEWDGMDLLSQLGVWS